MFVFIYYYCHLLSYFTSPGWDVYDCGAISGRRNRSTRRNPTPVPLVHHRSHETWPGPPRVESRRLTACATAGPTDGDCCFAIIQWQSRYVRQGKHRLYGSHVEIMIIMKFMNCLKRASRLGRWRFELCLRCTRFEPRPAFWLSDRL
jgi:hypothetical protein